MTGPAHGREEEAGLPPDPFLPGGGLDEPAALVEARVSVPDPEAAQRIANDLVARQLAACVQVLGPMTSVYTWQGTVHSNQEWLLLVKTTALSFPALAQAVRELHSYDVPEVVAVPITQALSEYAAWVRQRSDGIDDAELTGQDGD